MRLGEVRAARLRARAMRGGIVQILLGTVFLVGALAHALSPERHERSSLLWITGLVLISTVYVALGQRTLGRVRRWRRPSWLWVATAWGFLAVVLSGLLLRR